MSAQIDAPKYTYLKRGVYYFVTTLFFALPTSTFAIDSKTPIWAQVDQII